MTGKTYDRLLATAEAHVQQGHGIILDATFARREHRELLAEYFGKRGMAWRFIEAQASNSAVKQRLRVREAKSNQVSDARLEDFVKLTRRYESPAELSRDRLIKIRTSGPLAQTVTKALQSLVGLQVKPPGLGTRHERQS